MNWLSFAWYDTCIEKENFHYEISGSVFFIVAFFNLIDGKLTNGMKNKFVDWFDPYDWQTCSS